jgi:hypothetical protein
MSEAEEILLMALCVPSIATLHKGVVFILLLFLKRVQAHSEALRRCYCE